jgi:two-component system, chemotaxis family, CheB/CheR fusion protein
LIGPDASRKLAGRRDVQEGRQDVGTSRAKFPIAGIGASAGGVEALQALFKGLPSDSGMGFVIVSHLGRGQRSLLAEILGRSTDMTVTEATGGEVVAPDHVYVCPPDHTMTIAKGRLRLQDRAPAGLHMPIDIFLSSLAEDRGEDTIGLLLSGGGTDGTLGLKTIKEQGGLTLAQVADGGVSPKHTDMPDAAIAAGVVDLTIPVEEMPRRLVDHVRRYWPLIGSADFRAGAGEAGEAHYKAIHQTLLQQTGHDFSGYKQKTFGRRMHRRMQVLELTSLEDYVARLREASDEVRYLFRDLLIGVTDFFRDPDAFEMLESEVLPRLFEGRNGGEPVRVWVPGCATGEEVYSIAILLREQAAKRDKPPEVQIFATDIDETALGVARAGRYPASLVRQVSRERLERHFRKVDDFYVISRDIRDTCVFSTHNLIRDPPFSRIDLVSCRNLLIYFGAEFQARVMPVFHYALKPQGFLFLGTSENIGHSEDLFEAVDKKQRIFMRRARPAPHIQMPQTMPHRRRGPPRLSELRSEPPSRALELRRAVEARVVGRYAPAHVVIDRDGEIVHFSPRTGKYLEAPVGAPSRNLIAAARRGLKGELKSAVREVLDSGRRIERARVAVDIDDSQQLVNLVIEPFRQDDAEPLLLVVFQEVGAAMTAAEAIGPEVSESGDTVERLEHELADTRERLQITIEEYETSMEELKSANEELQSANEELQSTNEELETAKEELQSLNEELHTVNAQLARKVEEVNRATGDLRAIFESTRIGTVFLDETLVIRNFTPAATAVFSLIGSDCGRPLTDIASHAEVGDLRRDIAAVAESGEPIERRVRRNDGSAHYLMRILPFRLESGAIEGVVVTFVDVTGLAEAEEHQRVLVAELNHRVRNMLAVVVALAKQTLACNRPKRELKEALIGRIQSMANAYTLISQENWNDVALRDIVQVELEPYMNGAGDNAGRIAVEGPAVMCRPASALAFSLVVHELATNAAKYGALSDADGSLAVNWAVDAGETLVLEWRETSGRGFEPPEHTGLGSKLIERQIQSFPGATMKIEHAAQGLQAQFAIPLGDLFVPAEGDEG